MSGQDAPEIKILTVTKRGEYGLKEYIVELHDGESAVLFALTFYSHSVPAFGKAHISRVEAREMKPAAQQFMQGKVVGERDL